MKIFVGSDHGGYYLKEKVEAYLARNKYDVEDIGAKELNPEDDYPQFAHRAVMKILSTPEKENPRAILLCRGGQGMAIAANRFAGIRASVIWSDNEARMTRLDNDSNVLCIPTDHINDEEVYQIIDTWLNTEFSKAPRHIRRLKEIDEFYPHS